MKHIYLSAMLMAASPLMAQYDLENIIDPIGWPVSYPGSAGFDTIPYSLGRQHDGTAWENVDLTINNKDAYGNPLLVGIYEWNPDSAAWQAAVQYEYTYTYDASNRVIGMVRTLDLGVYSIIRTAEYTLNSNGDYLIGLYTDSTSFGGFGFTTYAKDSLVYDGSNNLTALYRMEDDNGAWVTDDRFTFNYTSGNITEIIEEDYDNGTYELDSRQSLAYNAQGLLIEETNQYWNGSAWENEDKSEYTWDAAGRISTIADYVDTTGSWLNEDRDNITYLNATGGKLASWLEELGNGTTWTNDYQFEVFYNGAELSHANGYAWNGSAFETTITRDYIFTDTSTTGTPAPPTNLIANGSGRAPGISLSWTDNSGNETGFTLERSTDGNVFTTVADLPANSTSYVDSVGLTAATTYTYRVSAYNASGSSAPSNAASATTWTTGLGTQDAQAVSVFPNPAADAVTISAPAGSIINLSDINGSILFATSAQSDVTNMSVNHLAKTIYLISIANASGTTVQKLVVQ